MDLVQILSRNRGAGQPLPGKVRSRSAGSEPTGGRPDWPVATATSAKYERRVGAHELTVRGDVERFEPPSERRERHIRSEISFRTRSFGVWGSTASCGRSA